MLEEEFYKKIGFKQLSEIQQKAMKSDRNTLVLGSCGSGKTEMALSKIFKWGKKALLVEPMKTLATSLRDRANEYSEKLNIEKWSIHHSSKSDDTFLDNKYCVTTIDQVLAGYLAIGKQSFIKGKNILKSNIVFDEVQLFDTEKMLLTTINMLDELYKNGNKFIIMTATMPSYLINFLQERYDLNIIIAETVRVKDRETRIRYIERLNYEIINNTKEKQIIICNTIADQMEIYKNLDKDRVIILNSKFLSKDRMKIEKSVFEFFGKDSKGNDKILLATQIIEVGMDISANLVYSANCPIDNLIQRDGRCARWGGVGEVIVFKKINYIYNEKIVERTNNIIKENQGTIFSWEVQKKWINDILNNFYEKNVNNKTLRENKMIFKEINKSKLIRDIQNINVIVKKGEVEKGDFNRESIGISLNEFEKISKVNYIYILKKSVVKEVEKTQVESSSTIVIGGNQCVYDELGFRFIEENIINSYIKDFPYKEDNIIKFDDYVEESWINHANFTKKFFEKNLKKDKLEGILKEYINENLNEIIFYGGLHDVGKLDKEWQRKCKQKLLAHFPFSKRATEYRDHAAIGYYNIKRYTDKIIANMILQHHRRISLVDGIPITTTSWNFHEETNNILKEYGFYKDLIKRSDIKKIFSKEIITPKDKEWIILVYLIGVLMESEIEAIQKYIKNML